MNPANLIAYLAAHDVPANVNASGALNVFTPYSRVENGACVSFREWEVIPATLQEVRAYLGY